MKSLFFEILKHITMKNTTKFLFISLLIVIMYSCKKDNDTEHTSPTSFMIYPNYSSLKVGNYWIYQEFDIDTNGIATPKNIFDSCYVEKDTILNGKTYKKIVKPKPYSTTQYGFSLERDSLHYIVNSVGQILFSSRDFSSIINIRYNMATSTDTLCQIIRQMVDKNLSITTPAGTFTTSDAKETFFMFPNFIQWGNHRTKHTRYSENIGVVVETLPFYLSDPNYVERRLLRYHLN